MEARGSGNPYKNGIPPANSQSKLRSQVTISTEGTMQLNARFLLLLLGAALIQAGPAPKVIEKKSLAEQTKEETKTEDLKIEETGEDKDRAKKAAFCLQIEPGYPQQAQIAVNENPLAVQNIPLAVQAQSIPQQVQTLSFVQSLPQAVPQASIVLPQPMVQPVQTLQILQPQSQPCMQSAAVNIIQPASQSNNVQTVQKPKTVPRPTPTPAKEAVPAPEPAKPMRIEQQPQPLPVPQETIAMMPVAPACEHIMLFPHHDHPNYVPAPSIAPCNNPLHGIISECTCQKVGPIGVSMLPMMHYPGFTSAQMLMPPHVFAKPQIVEPNGKPNAYINVNNQHSKHHGHQKYFQKVHVHGPEGSAHISEVINNPSGGGFAISAVVPGYRSFEPMQQVMYPVAGPMLRSKHNVLSSPVNSEVYDLMQTNKTPRQADASQLSPEKTEEIKQGEEQAMLIDGRRNTRSNKEEKKTAAATSTISVKN